MAAATQVTQATQYTIDFTWFGVRPTSTGDQRRVFLLEKKNTHSRSLFSLGKKRKSNLRCGRKLAAGDLTRVSEKPDEQPELKERCRKKAPFSLSGGSLFIGENPPHMIRGHHL